MKGCQRCIACETLASPGPGGHRGRGAMDGFGREEVLARKRQQLDRGSRVLTRASIFGLYAFTSADDECDATRQPSHLNIIELEFLQNLPYPDALCPDQTDSTSIHSIL